MGSVQSQRKFEIVTPSHLYMIHELGPLYEEAISRLIEAGIVGFHAEGGQRGRAEAIL